MKLDEWKSRVVYSPAQTLFVMKAAMLHSPDREDAREHAAFSRALVEILLMANDLLDEESRRSIEAAGTDDLDTLTELFLPHSIRATLANGADAYDTMLARASIIFTQLALRADVRARAGADAMDLGALFEARTGLSLSDYFAIGWMLLYWFGDGARTRVVDPRFIVDGEESQP